MGRTLWCRGMAQPEIAPDGFAGEIGVEWLSLDPDDARARIAVEPRHLQPYGIVHGGIHCSVIETLASLGGALWLGEKGKVVGVNNNTDFYRAVSDGDLTSTATPLHRGRSQQVWVVETVADDGGKLVARGQVRLQNLYPDS